MIKALLVAQREYLENVKTKGFWFSTLIMPVLFGASMFVPLWIELTKDAKVYAVVDESGWMMEAVDLRVLHSDLLDLFEAATPEQTEVLFPAPVRELAQALAPLTAEEKDRSVTRLCDDPDAGADLPETVNASIRSEGKAVLDWWAGVSDKMARALVPGCSRGRYSRRDVPATITVDELNQMVMDEDLFAYFLIGDAPVDSSSGCRYASANLTDTDLQQWFEGLADEAVRARRLAGKDIDGELAAWISKGLIFEGRLINKDGDREAEKEDAIAQWVPVAFVYLLWISVFMVAMMMLTSTVTEKSNRLVEVLLSSISAMELLAGKMLGIMATGLTTVGTWLVGFLLLVHFLPILMGVEKEFSLATIASQPVYLISFLVYFSLGYLFYGAVLVGLGSVCDNLKDAQNMTSPVTLFLFIPMLLMVPIGQDPNGTLARVLSYVPPLTPFVMMNRAAGSPSTLDYVLTTLLLVVSVIVALWASAKIFRVGILLSGKPPKLKELWHFLKMPT